MRNKIFLTSTVSESATHIGKKLDAKNKKYKTLFITTAADGEEGDKEWLDEDKQALVKAGFDLTDYTIAGKSKAQIKKDVNSTEVIYMSGGDTFYLLYQMQITKSKNIFVDAVKSGKIYIGTSAGSIIAGPSIHPTEVLEHEVWKDKIIDTDGLGLVDVVVFPHWGSEHFRDRYLNQRLGHAYNTDHKIILLNDYQYLEVLDEGYKIVDVRTD